MIEKKQDEIIEKINELSEVKKYKELKKILNSNEKYNNLLKEAGEYENNRDKIIEIRKELFLIPEFKEYITLDTTLRMYFGKIGKIITNIVSNHTCIR